MELNEFLKKKGKKIVVSNNTNNINSLYKKYVIDEKGILVDANSSTIYKLANDLYVSYNSFNNINCKNIITNEEALNILDIHIHNSTYDFIPNNCKSLETSNEIFKVINQIRKGLIINSSSKRINELLKLIDDYEDILISNNYLDNVLLLKEAIRYLDNIDDIRLYFSFINDVSIGLLKRERLTYLEDLFINKLANKLNIDIEKIELNSYGINNKEFVNSYGSYNEVRYIIDDIIKNKKDISDVCAIYPSYEYENHLKGLLEANNIPFRFINGVHGSSTNIVQLFKDILSFAKTDFTYKELKKIIYNPLLSLINVVDEKASYYNLIYCYNDISNNNILITKERYYEFIDKFNKGQINKYGKEDRYKYFIMFLNDLLATFDNYTSISKLFMDILHFIDKYSNNQNKEKMTLLPILKKQSRIFDLYSDLSFEESLSRIDDYLDSIMYNEQEDNNSISLYYFKDFLVLDRKKVYLIGLSSSSLIKKEVDSPVLLDEELLQCLDNNYYLRLSKNINKDYQHMLDDTLSTNDIDITYIYSSFDNVDLKESSPSTYYLNSRKDEKEIKYSYDVSLNGIYVNGKDLSSLVRKEEVDESQTNGDINIENEKKHLDIDNINKKVEVKAEKIIKNTNRNMSPSAMSILTNCPLQYYYQYILKLANVNLHDIDPSSYLERNQRGTMFHRIMELYCREAFNFKNYSFDEALYKKCFEIASNEMDEQAYAFNGFVKKVELEEIDNLARTYLNRFTKEMIEDKSNGKDYRIIGCEFAFGPYSTTLNGEPLIYKYESEEKDYSITFNGSIDRFDGYVDDSGIFHIRVVDYKTGDLTRLKEKIKSFKALQHYIYPIVAITYVKENKEELERLFDSEITGIVLDSVKYELTEINDYLECVDNAYKCIVKTNDNLFDYRLILPSQVVEILDITEKYYQNDKEELISDLVLAHLKNKEGNNKEKNKSTMCEYCTYKKNCRFLLTKEDN